MPLTMRSQFALAHQASNTTVGLQVATPEPSKSKGDIPLLWSNTNGTSCNIPTWNSQLHSEFSVFSSVEDLIFDKDLFTHIVAQKDVGSNFYIGVEELEQFIDMILYMSPITFPGTRR
ncbi:hypothetical protein QE152_g5166 [Popillia japonica]|uniref:Uncharacterized protein n=1 Tax=Popillia japonica TaxID=7064 RepID=A0AAW1MXS2_POPJA